jgi:hypothetical protein
MVGLAVVGAFDGGTVGGLVLGLLVGAPLVTKKDALAAIKKMSANSKHGCD